MKLLTHNMLSSKGLKGVKVGFPLRIVARDVKVREVDFNPDFVARLLPKLDWAEVCRAAESLDQLGDLRPDDLERMGGQEGGYQHDQDFLKRAHHVLLEVEVINGELVCPETGRSFPIADGIPNMLLNEDEV